MLRILDCLKAKNSNPFDHHFFSLQIANIVAYVLCNDVSVVNPHPNRSPREGWGGLGELEVVPFFYAG
jgi:hypothetical protein